MYFLYMKKLFYFVLFLFFSVTVASADNIKFVQITDSHLSANSDYSIRVLKSAVEDINNQSDISFVFFGGDNINNPEPDDLKKFVSIISKLNVPYYIVLGNHDVYKSHNMSKVRYFEILRESNLFFRQRSANYKFVKDGFVFVTLDGAKEVIPGATGYYRKDTLEWLDRVLTKYKGKPVVIFQHFPIEYPAGMENRLKTHKTYKPEVYNEVLEKHNNVLAIVSGHFHVNYETMKNGVYHISSPSILEMPNSYKIIDIVTTPDFSPLIYTQLREFEVKD